MCSIKSLPLILILFSVFPVLLLQQIFENDKARCEYFNHDIPEKQDTKLEIQNELWNITGTGRNSAIKVLLSPCGNPLPPTVGCGPGAVVCMINTKNRRKSVLNAGKYFNYTVDEDSSKTILRSIDGQSCSPDENYTVIIEFDCSPNIKATPTFLYKDDCELRIGMIKSSCTPTCTTRVDGNFIDLRNLQLLGSIPVEEPVTKKSFLISFCNPAKQCGTDDTTVCETTGGNIIPIAKLSFQQITFTNNLIMKSHVGTTKRFRKDTEIEIKCNWNVQGISHLEYIVPFTQGRNYKFKGESSLACIKLPMNCVIRDSYENYWAYNLTSLYKPNGNWKVKNVTFGNIYINVCGPLRTPQPNRICSDQYSQVCQVNDPKQFVNLGSIPAEFHVTSEDTIKGKFVDGGICAVDQNLTYSTVIEFLCSRTEKGPVLSIIDNCTYKLKWETPAACAKQFVTSEDCLLSDVTGNINLSNLHKSLDREYNFAKTSYLRYNLCGPLNKPCNKNEDVSVCYVNNGQEHVAGFSKMELTRNDALLSIHLKGDKCNAQTMRMTKIYFHCNHFAPSDGNIRINMVKENCVFEINIDTPLACTVPSTTECKVYNDNNVFDLTPLALNNSNYVVQDGNIEYIVNICHSVTNVGNSLCPPATGVCMNKLTEPHMKHKYLSMGNVNSKSVPIIENGDLVIRYTAGSFCAEANEQRSTVIRFHCSRREEGPRLLKKDSCFHEFIWHTPTACGKQVLSLKTRETNTVCKYSHPHTGKIIDLGKIQKILRMEPKTGEFYQFSLCENNYTHCILNGTDCKTLESEVQLISSETDTFLEYTLKNQCTDRNTQANKLHIYLKCSNLLQGNEHFNVTGISNCILHIDLFTSLACISKESPLPIPDPIKPDVIVQTLKENNLQSNATRYVVQTLKENVTRYDITTKQPVNIPIHHNAALFNIPRVAIKSGDSGTTSEINKITPSHTLETLNQDDCIINNSKTNFKLNLKYIKPIYVTSVTGFNYTVTLNKPLSTCGGYICKDNSEVVLKTEECPAIELNTTHSVVKLLYKSDKLCDGSMFHSEIWLKCNSTIEQPSILREEKCNVIITYPLNEACMLLNTMETGSSSAEIPIYSSVGLFVIAILAIGGYLAIKKYPVKVFSRSCYQQIPDEIETPAVQFKMKEM